MASIAAGASARAGRGLHRRHVGDGVTDPVAAAASAINEGARSGLGRPSWAIVLAAATSEHEGETVSCCSAGCKEAFD